MGGDLKVEPLFPNHRFHRYPFYSRRTIIMPWLFKITVVVTFFLFKNILK